MFGLRMGAMGRVGAGLTLAQQAINILRRPGLESHVYMPGVGWVNGLSLTNTIMEDGTQAASVDTQMGYVGDAVSSGFGSDLGTNGGFGTDTGWTKGTGWTISGGAATHASGSTSELSQSITVTAGRAYQIEYTVSGYSDSGTGGISPRFNGGTVSAGSLLTGNGTKTQILVAVTGNNVLAFSVSSTVTCSIDNISVRELVGAIPARQATTANKPILRRGAVNRLLWSRDLRASTGSWANTDVTVTKDQVGYDGTANGACLVTQGSAGTASLVQNRSIPSAALTYTDTWHLKRGNTDWVRITNNTNGPDGRALWVNLATGALGVHNAIGLGTGAASIEDAGNGFWRVRLTVTPNGTGTSKSSQVYAATGDGVTTRVSGGTFIADAVQSENGSTASPYIPTTTAAASSPTGPYWAEFDGTDFLSLAAVPFQQADDHCVVTAVQPTNLTSPCTYFSIRSTAAANPIVCSLRADAANNQLRAAYRDDAGTLIFVGGPTGLVLGTRYVSSARRASGTAVVRTNGVAGTPVSLTALGATTVNAAAIGVDQTSTPSQQFIGGIYPVIAVKGTVTDAELATLERWVASLSGVTL